MKNTILNKAVIGKIAQALGDMNDLVIYVGGAAVSLYVDDPAAEDIRPTKDIDISLAILSLSELESIREKLTQKGFVQSSEDDIICRFRYEETKVDVMSTHPVGWAPANPWFAPGFASKQKIMLDHLPIHVLPLPYFLASKFSAFEDRGASDPRTSHDFEDIIYLLDNRTDVFHQLTNAAPDVKPYLLEQFRRILADSRKQEAILANLYYETRNERYRRILEGIRSFLSP